LCMWNLFTLFRHYNKKYFRPLLFVSAHWDIIIRYLTCFITTTCPMYKEHKQEKNAITCTQANTHTTSVQDREEPCRGATHNCYTFYNTSFLIVII
jgi:hypothetical protein